MLEEELTPTTQFAKATYYQQANSIVQGKHFHELASLIARPVPYLHQTNRNEILSI